MGVFIQKKETQYDFNGIVDESIRYIERVQLLKHDLWNRFVSGVGEQIESRN